MLATLDTFNATTGVREEVFQLAGLPNHPLWVLAVEATGTWVAGSKDSYVENSLSTAGFRRRPPWGGVPPPPFRVASNPFGGVVCGLL